mgnify:CR=1 FL=1
MVTTPTTHAFYMNAINLADDLQSGKIENLQEAKSNSQSLVQRQREGLRKTSQEIVSEESMSDRLMKDAKSMVTMRETSKEFRNQYSDQEPNSYDPDIKQKGDIEGMIKGFESFRSNAYKDGPDRYSIGYGTKASGPNQVISEEEASRLMRQDLAKARKIVDDHADKHGYTWSNNQRDALASFTYNSGNGGLNDLTERGTRGDEEISFMILEYVYADGKKLAGLVERRKAEAKLFAEGYD